MRLIPYKKIELATNLSKEETARILQNNTRFKTDTIFRLNIPKDNYLFEGNIYNDTFEIQKIIKGKNSFIPQIKGEIKTKKQETIITLSFKIHGFVIVFMTIWLGAVSFVLILTITSIFTRNTNPLIILMPLFMLTFGIKLSQYGFNSGTNNSINDLKKILNGHIITEKPQYKKMY